MPNDLTGMVAVITGASRGVGRGVALGLCANGATVHITGRTLRDGEAREANLTGSLQNTCQECNAAGGKCFAHLCDHTDDNQTRNVFQAILAQHGQIDILVNSVWGGYEAMVDEQGRFTWALPFWEQPVTRWDRMFTAGLRARYVAAQEAARNMVSRRRGLIVNISSWAAQKYVANVAYGVATAAMDRMTRDMAHELRDYNVAVISLYPGLVRTERVLAAQFFDLSNSESPQFLGLAIAALATDPQIMRRSGSAVVAAEVARAFGFTDVDGKQPAPLTLEAA
jgi:NAD(P)-dependent dehydrogenase (short-subunit alcohol dehydrogenase family)